MPVKRKSRGRSKGRKGRTGYVHCYYCGSLVPRDKAKKIVRPSFPIDPNLLRDLKAKGARISFGQVVKYVCISCAIHRGIVKIRSEEERKLRPRRFGGPARI